MATVTLFEYLRTFDEVQSVECFRCFSIDAEVDYVHILLFELNEQGYFEEVVIEEF